MTSPQSNGGQTQNTQVGGAPRKPLELLAAIANAVALVMSMAALGLSTWALKDQIKTNQSQMKVDDIEQEQYKRRYVARVAIWLEQPSGSAGTAAATPGASPGRAGGRLLVQNRASAPAVNVWLDATAVPMGLGGAPVSGTIMLPNIPPCSLLSFSLPVTMREGFTAGMETGLTVTDIRFTDGATNSWKRTSLGEVTAEAVAPGAGEQQSLPAHLKINFEGVQDCGE